MKPVIVSTTIERDPDEVYAFLDVIANHERFNDHLMTDWTYSGPPTGLGAKATATANMAGRREPVEIEVVETTVATTIVERQVSHRGVRVTAGTYRIAAADGAGAKVTFEYAWQHAPRIERLLAPLVRALMRRALPRSMDRLAASCQRPGDGRGRRVLPDRTRHAGPLRRSHPRARQCAASAGHQSVDIRTFHAQLVRRRRRLPAARRCSRPRSRRS